MELNKLKVKVSTANWFKQFVEIQRQAAVRAVEQGAPVELVQDQFESAVCSAAFEAVEFGDADEQPSE